MTEPTPPIFPAQQTMEKHFLKSFHIAGFSYYQGAYAFGKLAIGALLEIVPDFTNHHDENAVELRFEGTKLGYIPRDENREIAILLKAGHPVFEAVVQQISPEEHPERQVRVGVFVVAGG